MQIYFERSGGFTGLRLQSAVDTAELPVDEEEAWKEALKEAEFFNLSSDLPEASKADSFVYKLTVVTAEREHTALCTDETMPEELRPMLRQLTIMAR